MFKSNGILRRITFLGVLLTVGSLTALGQVQTGEILGTVTDNTGASVPAATVTITNAGTGLARQVKTDGQGQYAMADLSIGNYQAKVEMQGFAVQTITGLVLSVGQNLVANFKLQVGTVAQEVTVNTTATAQVTRPPPRWGRLWAKPSCSSCRSTGGITCNSSLLYREYNRSRRLPADPIPEIPKD